ARYSETGTPGSESGLKKRTGGNTGTALQADSTGIARFGGGVRSWVGTHAGSNPTHHTYRETIHRPWRAVMGRHEAVALIGAFKVERCDQGADFMLPVVRPRSLAESGHAEVAAKP
ncbi:DUF7848 domain-containing protein, partial [Actinacidiphila soli]